MTGEREQPAAWRFDRFTLDLARGVLLGPDGAEVPLRPKALALLRLLVENPGRVVDRDAIMAAVWPNVVVGDESITQCVRDIRKALGDEAQQLLKTVPKRGYLLAAEVTPAESIPPPPPPRTERRLAAVLAADIVGYSRLIEQDEAATLAAIKALRQQAIDPLLAEHKGRIVKLMGDGAIVEFASVVDAVACAVAIQKAVADLQGNTLPDRRIVFRIGINLGDVVVDGDDLMGDGVNIAARLEQLCEPGGVLVSGTAFDHLQGRLGMPLEFTGEQQVKNITRPVRAYRVRLDGTAGRSVLRRPGRYAAVLAALGLVASLAGGAWLLFKPQPLRGNPSIAILPFNDLSGDETTGRLGAAIADDIVTDLSRFRTVDVIAINSSKAYADRHAEPTQIGRELDVGLVLDGSIQRDPDHVRVNAKLYDARSGASLWSERWDRPAADLFAVQTEITERTVNDINRVAGLKLEVQAHRKRPSDLDAYELVALSSQSRAGTESEVGQALAYAEEAIAKDPSFARAYIAKAWALWQSGRFGGKYADITAKMEGLARTATELDPYDALAFTTLGFAISYRRPGAEALPFLERSLELGPSYADVLVRSAETLAFEGQPDRSAGLCDRAMRLNPSPPQFYLLFCATPWFLASQYQQMIDGYAHYTSTLSQYHLAWRTLALAEMGKDKETAAASETLQQRFPEVTYEYFLNNGWTFARAEDQAKVLGAYRKAGLRLCATAAEMIATPTPRTLPECETERANRQAAAP